MAKRGQTDQDAPRRLEVPVVEADPEVGLDRTQAEQRLKGGWANVAVASPTKSEKEIIKSNVFTFFNLIFIVLAAALIAVGSYKDATFLFIALANTAIGIVQALEETGRDKDVKVTAIDAGPETLEIMAEPGSPFVANVAQQPHLIGQTSADNVARYFAGQKLPVQTFIPVVPVKGPQEAKAVYKQLGYGELQ